MAKEAKSFASTLKLSEDDARKEIIMRREARGTAETPAELVEYFLNTVADDMEFEVARNRPKLDAAFFK
jgi:hypothetical protein